MGNKNAGSDKRGGYPGGKPAENVKPPRKTPSATIRPGNGKPSRDADRG